MANREIIEEKSYKTVYREGNVIDFNRRQKQGGFQ